MNKGVQPKILDCKFLQLWIIQAPLSLSAPPPPPPTPPPPPPTPTHTPHPHPHPHTHTLQTQLHNTIIHPTQMHNTIIHPMLTRRVHSYISNLFRYSLIYFHPVEKNSTRTAVVVIPNTLWWNAPMLCHLWCRTNPALMRTSTNNPLFSSSCTNWPIDVHPTWSKETIF